MKLGATNRRIGLLAAAFLILLAAALARAVWLQVIKGPEYAAMAVRQHRETVVVPAGARDDRRPQRRAARDRRSSDDGLREPAAGRRRARPHAVRRQDLRRRSGGALPDADRPLARVRVRRSGRRIRARPRSSRSSGYAGLGFYPEELRFYPQGPVAAQILGYAGLDNKGLEGLERSLEGTLAGKPGSQTIVKDPFGRALDVVETKPETPGKDVRLTIDRQIQANAEEVLAETVRRWSREVRDGGRHGSADGRGPRDGDGAAVQREPLLDDARGSAP